MNSVISSLALVVAASSNGAAATDFSQPDFLFAREILTELSTALRHPRDERLGVGAWTSALACTADLESQSPGLVDETACATTKTNDGGDCVWCDASALIGTGVCVGPDLKDQTGPVWDAVCGASADDATPTVLDDNGLPDMMKCSLDESLSIVADEATCAARKDADGEGCAWCGVSFLGSGACTTSGVKTTISFLCSAAAGEEITLTKEGSYLRGVHDENALEDRL